MEVKLPLIFQLAFIELALQTVLFVVLALLYSSAGFEHLNTAHVRELGTGAIFLPLFVTVVLLAPVTEEFIFRLPLVYSRTFLLMALLMFLVCLGPAVALTFRLPLLPYAVAAILLLALAVWLLSYRRLRVRLYLLWKRHFGPVFYTFTAAFALLHLLNMPGSAMPASLLLLLVLHKFVGGIFLGYTRLRLGMGWAVALHMFNNFIALLVLYGYWAGV